MINQFLVLMSIINSMIKGLKMQHMKKIAAILCFTVVTIYSIDQEQERFNHLRGMQHERERGLLSLAKRIKIESHALPLYERDAYMVWNPPAHVDPRASFQEFIQKVTESYAQGADIQNLLDQAPIDKHSLNEPANFAIYALVIQKLYLARLVSEYQKSVEELRQLNQEIHEIVNDNQ